MSSAWNLYRLTTIVKAKRLPELFAITVRLRLLKLRPCVLLTYAKSRMGKLTKFVEFLRSEQDGTCWEDPTYRVYDLDRGNGRNTVFKATRALGYSSSFELRSDLALLGYRGEVYGPLCRWFAWEGLRTGRIRQRPLRSSIHLALKAAPRKRPGRPSRAIEAGADQNKQNKS